MNAVCKTATSLLIESVFKTITALQTSRFHLLKMPQWNCCQCGVKSNWRNKPSFRKVTAELQEKSGGKVKENDYICDTCRAGLKRRGKENEGGQNCGESEKPRQSSRYLMLTDLTPYLFYFVFHEYSNSEITYNR